MSQRIHHHRVRIDARVDRYMHRGVISVAHDTTLREVERLLDARDISCVLVRENERPIGVVSRTDLLRVARRGAASHGGALAPLPAVVAGALCARAPITLPVDSTVSEAALRMVAERVHRVFVASETGAIAGILSTKDVLSAVVAARVATRLSEVMSHPIYTIPAEATIAHATDRLAHAHVTGVTVVDEEGWPLGFYGQREALLARTRSGETRVEEAMNCALVCVHQRAELHRAAALASAARARRVLVIEDRRAIGVLSPLDFARAVSAAARPPSAARGGVRDQRA